MDRWSLVFCVLPRKRWKIESGRIVRDGRIRPFSIATLRTRLGNHYYMDPQAYVDHLILKYHLLSSRPYSDRESR